MGSIELLTTGVGGGVVVAVVTFLAKNFPEWWRHRGEQAAQKADAAARAQEQAFMLLTQASERMDEEIARLGKKASSQQEQINAQAHQIKDLQGDNSALAEENRLFRRVVLGIVHRLEVIAAWVRDGHQPPPPYTTDQLLAYIREHVPHVEKDT